MTQNITFSSPLWRYSALKGSWFFVTIPQEDTELIRWVEDKTVRGWGSIPVEVKIGTSTWQTSIFPDKEKTYLLPIKAAIRKQENLHEGMGIRCSISLL